MTFYEYLSSADLKEKCLDICRLAYLYVLLCELRSLGVLSIDNSGNLKLNNSNEVKK